MWSRQVPTEFHVLRGTQEMNQDLFRGFDDGTVTLYGVTFQTLYLPLNDCLPSSAIEDIHPYNPFFATLARFNTKKVWTPPCSLTAT